MTRNLQTLADEYATALQGCLESSSEASLQSAYELGRRALVEGLSLLELVSQHHAVLQQALHRDHPGVRESSAAFEAAQTFLAESLSTVEMAHREFQDAIIALRHLNQRLEDEVRRVAHALHDDAGQLLVAVHLALHELAREHPPAAESIGEVRRQLDEVEQRLRRLSHELRPTILDDLGLVPALEELARGVALRTGIPIEVEGLRDGRLPSHVETAVYRIVQEALTNATRHGSPSHIWVSVDLGPDGLRCQVRDNGMGFDPQAVLERATGRGLGLIGMRERLNTLEGSLTIRSAPGHGTQLLIHIPEGVGDADPSSARG